MQFPNIFPFLSHGTARVARNATAMLLATVVLIAHAIATTTSKPPDPDVEWTKINTALPSNPRQSADTELDSLVANAIATNNPASALKGILLRLKLAAKMSDENEYLDSINALAKYCDTVPGTLKPMVNALLARAWEDVLLRQRQAPQKRPHISVDGNDPHTWDLTRISEEIARRYALALADATTLQQIPVGTLKDVLHNSDYPDTRRPTLFDIVAHQAIEFFSNDATTESRAEDDRLPSPDGAILGSAEAFLAWHPHTSEATPSHFRTLALFQDLMQFHQADAARTVAFADADLQRILWAKRILGNTGNTRVRVEQALRAHFERWKNLDLSADTAAELALFHFDEKNATAILESYKAAMLGIATHPGSYGAKRCRAIVTELEKRELRAIQTEFTWNAPWPDIKIDSRNLEKLHFRAVRAEWKDYLSREHNRPHKLNEKEVAALFRKTPAKTWQVALPKTDYALGTHTVPAPDDLAPGFYFIIASIDEKFSSTQNSYSCQPIWVSDLAIAHTIEDGKKIHGFVVNAVTGEPIPDTTVQAWRRVGGNRIEHTPVKTDATGTFSITTPNPATALLLATAPNGHSISCEKTSPGYAAPGAKTESATPERMRYHVKFLTDRMIYQPGQPVHFKAIVYTANNATSRYGVAENRKITVVLDDSHEKEAARLELRTNGNGSASGTFTLPQARLNGPCTLRTLGAENGRAHIRFEEYKRPKFEVTLAKPSTAPRLHEPVTIEGNATSLMGEPIAGAKIRWSVKRSTRLPRWSAQELEKSTEKIAHGSAITDATGKFSITFTATPEKTITAKNAPQFHYDIHVKITDATGATRENTLTLVAAHTTLQADITASDWQTTDKSVALRIITSNLERIPQKASGLVTLYALRQPEKILRPNPSAFLDATLYATALNNTTKWEEEDGIITQAFTTDATGKTTLNIPLPAGAYRAVLTTQDANGNPVSARTDIIVADTAAPRTPLKIPFRLAIEENTRPLQPGDTFTALWSSGYPGARAHVTFTQNGKILHQFWTDPARNQQTITLPITAQHRGGFTLHVFQVSENRLYSQIETVDIPWENKKLNLAWERFNSKLTPGTREIWTLRVTSPPNPTGAPQSIPEIAATLYDASLDSVRNHQWHDFLEIFHKEDNPYPGSILPRFSNHKHYAPITNNLPGNTRKESLLMGVYRQFGIIIDGAQFPTRRHHNGDLSGPLDNDDANGIKIHGCPSTKDGNDTDLCPPHLSSTLPLRKNLGETAFFQPALISQNDGSIRIEFTAPKALTHWAVLVHAHDKQLRSATLNDATIYTTQSLIVQPCPPRFARGGKTLEFTVKLINTTDSAQSGRVRLNFSDADTLAPVDTPLGNITPERSFELPANASRTFAWRINIPNDQGALVYKVIAAAGLATDGEEGLLPVTPANPPGAPTPE